VRSAASLDAVVLSNPARLRLRVRVQPRASRRRIAGTHDGALKVQVQAPPVGGAANAALADLLAEVLGVRRGDVRIVSGQRGRSKTVDIVTPDPEAVRGALQGFV